MSQLNTETKLVNVLNKTVVNFLLFIAAMGIVTAILSWGQNPGSLVFTGTAIVVATCFMVLYIFLFQFHREVLHVTRKVFFMLITIILFIAVTKVVAGLPKENLIFLIPFAVIPIIIRTFYDARLALMILLLTLILCSFLVPQPLEFVFVNFIAGIAAIFTLKKVYRKSRLFFTSFIVIITYAVVWTGINFMEGGMLPEDFSNTLLLFAGNGLLVLISFPLVFLFEQDFLLLSDATLIELTDTNQPLLRKFAEDAPGSFQHSLQVSHLAEEAARVIGANYLLVRTGSLYHDIGKIGNPKYFVENQGDEISPHEKLDPKESARMIISHVRNGVNLAKNYKLPIQIIDFIRMHHGTTVAYFFYKKYIDQHPGEESGLAGEKPFTYPGPKPFSKETAVVMMADAVEAGSRSLTSFTEKSISELVERIIYLQEQDGQFSEVPLTFKDMSDIKDVLKRRLSNIYHARVVYPDRTNAYQ
jgi:hypothetical protein